LHTGVRVACGPKSQCHCQFLLNWNSCSECWYPYSQFSDRINSSVVKNSAGAIQVNFLYRQLNSWHFKSANHTVHSPLSVQLRLPPASFSSLFLDNMIFTNMKVVLATKTTSSHQEQPNAGGLHLAAHFLECAPSCPNFNLGASRTNPARFCYALTLRQNARLHTACTLLPRRTKN
jgi:hypothetical protein